MNNMGPLITFHKKNPAWCFPRVAPHRLKPKPPTTDTSLPVRQVEEYRHSRRKGRSDLRLQYIHCMERSGSCKSFFFFSQNKPPTNYLTKSDNRKKKANQHPRFLVYDNNVLLFLWKVLVEEEGGCGGNRETFQTARQTPIIGVS